MNNLSESNESEFNLPLLLSAISRRKKSFILISFSIFLLSGIYAVAKKSVWEGTFQIVLKKDEKKDTLSSLINTRSPISLLANKSSINKLNTEILILQSPSVLKPVYDYVKEEYNLLGYNTSKFRFRKWKKKNLLVKLEKKSDVLKISYLDKEKDLIIPVLNKISRKYQTYSGRDRLKSLSNAKKYLDKQVLIYKEKARISSNELQAYANLHNIGILSPGVKLNSKEKTEKRIPNSSPTNVLMLDLESKYIGSKNQVTLINEKLKQLENIDEKASLDKRIAIYTSLFDSKRTLEFKETLKKIDTELVRYKSGFNNEYPKIKNLERLKNETFQQLKAFVIGTLEGQKKDQMALKNASERPQEVISKYKDLFRIHKLNLETLSNLELERKINELSLAKKTDPWELISNPLVFDKPTAPNRIRIVFIGLFLGLSLGTLYVRYKDKNSELIYDKNDIDIFLGEKKSFDFSNIDNNKLEELIDNLISQYFAKEKLNILTLGDFKTERASNILALIKNNKNILNVVNNLKDIEESSKMLIFISFSNLNKKELFYISQFLNLRKDLEISTVYI